MGIGTERLSLYFETNDVTVDIKKRALLPSLCGPKTYETARASVAPKVPGEVACGKIMDMLHTHFDP